MGLQGAILKLLHRCQQDWQGPLFLHDHFEGGRSDLNLTTVLQKMIVQRPCTGLGITDQILG